MLNVQLIDQEPASRAVKTNVTSAWLV